LIVSGLVFIVPWAAARYSRDGLNFLMKMFSTDVANRMGSVADPIDINMPPFLYYCNIFVKSPGLMLSLLLSVISVITLILTRQKMDPLLRRAAVGCFLWAFVPMVSYSLMNVKYCWYSYSTLMAMPPLAGILVSAAFHALKGLRWKKAYSAVLGASLLLLAVFTVQNIIGVAQTDDTHTVQAFLKDDLDRDLDSGVHAYIQFTEGKRTIWMPGDMLAALYAGDVACMDGGVEGYLSDEDGAILYVCKDNNMDEINSLVEQEAVRNENYYIIAFEK
ncbi:MAG: hypothetical protein PHY64_08290, partial [Eubacteriales bacterium]|nr:hypothetical protein [Eubacteriales bacterium]